MTDISGGSIVALFMSLDRTSHRSDRHISAPKSRAWWVLDRKQRMQMRPPQWLRLGHNNFLLWKELRDLDHAREFGAAEAFNQSHVLFFVLLRPR